MAIQIGANRLERHNGGSGVLLGGVPGVEPGYVVILGGGVVGMAALKMAMGLGAAVTVLDIDMDRLSYLDDLYDTKIQTLYSTPSSIEAALLAADLVIGAVLIPGGAAPKLIKREHLAKMKPGSVIVDVAVDQGGCAETTKMTYHDDPTYVIDNVVHYCVANMPGAVSKTSTHALTNATLRYGIKIASMGIEAVASGDDLFVPGVSTYNGHLTCKGTAQAFGMEYTDLKTLL
jgi:alanine dehydrogenase